MMRARASAVMGVTSLGLATTARQDHEHVCPTHSNQTNEGGYLTDISSGEGGRHLG
jgi:hypothetical protein